MIHLVPYVRRSDWEPHAELVAALREQFADDGGIEFGPLDEIHSDRLSEVTAAIVDGPTVEQLAPLSKVEFIQSTWAGVETILPAVPDDVHVARMIDPQLADTMAEAVLAWTLYLHRDMPRYARQQHRRIWDPDPNRVRTEETRVGILGLGELGRESARRLASNSFDVAGWSQSPKSVDDVSCFEGPDGLPRLLTRSDIVVNLLPDTTATRGLLGAEAFARMPRGSSIINFGRGATIDDDALLAALDRGWIDHAVLDVFTVEPLPDDHPYWDHPRVTVLPHISGPTSFDSAAVIAADNVRRFLSDGTLPTDALIDRARGY